MQINIIEYLERKLIQENLDKPAVIEGERVILFRELILRAKLLAIKIISMESSYNKPVAIYLPKSTETVVSDLAIIYSGNFYTNLDTKSPLQRVQNVVSNINPAFIITNIELENIVISMGIDRERIILIDHESEGNKIIDYELISERLSHIIDTDPLCIINTSGSTGTPKGVVLNHRSFIDFTEWAIETLGISNNETVGSLSPTVFDIFSFELCMLMSKSATIVLIPETLAAFPITILEILNKQRVTFIFWVPTIMVNIANMDLLTKTPLTDLKTIWFAGEVFPTKQFNYWKKQLPDRKFVNLYGPIEITLDCTYYIVNRVINDDEPIPIGYACRNTDILILNDENKIAQINEPGELCVRGSSLAMGYYNNAEKTAEAFIQNPLNDHYPEIIYKTGDIVYLNEHGEIVFKGRKDSLIKHLGYRIELGEIEHVIVNTLKLVDNACVVYNKNKKEITVIYESNKEIPDIEFRKSLLNVFPKYMVPTVYKSMQLLPRNTNGKIDRLALSKNINDN